MNYIDRIAHDIYRRAGGVGEPGQDDMRLYRLYAVLALVVGERVTSEMVHDAWSAWMASHQPDHRSLVPFEELTLAVQELDDPYRDAIRKVVRSYRTTA